MKIVSARITRVPGHHLFNLPTVRVTYEDGREEKLFTYYPDEITLTAPEFIGLTREEAFQLKRRKDRDYLRS